LSFESSRIDELIQPLWSYCVGCSEDSSAAILSNALLTSQPSIEHSFSIKQDSHRCSDSSTSSELDPQLAILDDEEDSVDNDNHVTPSIVPPVHSNTDAMSRVIRRAVSLEPSDFTHASRSTTLTLPTTLSTFYSRRRSFTESSTANLIEPFVWNVFEAFGKNANLSTPAKQQHRQQVEQDQFQPTQFVDRSRMLLVFNSLLKRNPKHNLHLFLVEMTTQLEKSVAASSSATTATTIPSSVATATATSNQFSVGEFSLIVLRATRAVRRLRMDEGWSPTECLVLITVAALNFVETCETSSSIVQKGVVELENDGSSNMEKLGGDLRHAQNNRRPREVHFAAPQVITSRTARDFSHFE